MPQKQKKIIASDMDIPQRFTRKVDEATDCEFEIQRLQEIEPARREDVEVLLLGNNKLVTKGTFEEMPHIKLIQTHSAGIDALDFAAVPSRVIVSSNAGAYSEMIAEHVFGMIISLGRNLVRNHKMLKDGTYENSTDGLFLGGKTIGIVGAGGIGQSVARVAKSFRMETIGINSTGKKVPGFDIVWKMDGLDELLRRSDVVVIALPLNIHTRHLIDAKRLSLLKEGCILVNVARGAIIEQDALYAHLKAHPSFKAGIDVWWRYPGKDEKFAQDYPFFDLPNFMASPHNADGVPESREIGLDLAFENIIRFLTGEPVERVANKADYIGLQRQQH